METQVLGHFEYLQTRAVAYGGSLLRQGTDMSFTISMADYVSEKATAVHLERGRQDEDYATTKEVSCLRRHLGSLMWAGRAEREFHIFCATVEHT
eukprot:2023539-Amphidinium_carterae.1